MDKRMLDAFTMVDFTHVLAGPHCTKMLAEHADEINAAIEAWLATVDNDFYRRSHTPAKKNPQRPDSDHPGSDGAGPQPGTGDRAYAYRPGFRQCQNPAQPHTLFTVSRLTSAGSGHAGPDNDDVLSTRLVYTETQIQVLENAGIIASKNI